MAAASYAFFRAGHARAELSGDFAAALELDQSYVTGFPNATDIAFTADRRAVVTSKTGDILIRRLDGSVVVISGTFPNLDTASEKGLNGVVADPTQGTAFYFYADDGPSITDKHRVYHGVLAPNDTLAVDLEHPIVGAGVNAQDEGLEGPANHDGGGLSIYDGHLYVSVGDTGANASPPVNKYGSCLNKGNGKILRLNLDGTIPADNPLIGESSVTGCDGTTAPWISAAPDQRIYAWGLRNPFRFWVDPHTGRMWIGDVGEITREEIDVSAPAVSYTGQHFGYPFREGFWNWNENGGSLADHDCDTEIPGRSCTDPVADYDHGIGICVIGGVIPEGCGWNSAFGGALYYWFADYGAGFLHALRVKADRSGVESATPVEVGTFASGAAAIRQGPNGAVYLVNTANGSVSEIKPKDQTGSDCLSSGGTGGAGGSGAGGATSGTGGVAGAAGGSAARGGKGGTSSGSGGTHAEGGGTSHAGSTSAGEAGAPDGMGGIETTAGAAGDTAHPSAGNDGGEAANAGGTGALTGGANHGGANHGGANHGGVNHGGTPPSAASSDDSGCSCRISSDIGSAATSVSGLIGLAFFAFRRRSLRARLRA